MRRLLAALLRGIHRILPRSWAEAHHAAAVLHHLVRGLTAITGVLAALWAIT
jgi:hypothetical protein